MKPLLVFLLLTVTHSLYATELLKVDGIKSETESSCHKGIPVVLLFMTKAESDAQAEQDDNELYADWSYYLNNGIPGISKKIKIITTSVTSGRALFKSKKIPKSMFSLVFIPCRKRALYAGDAILEPDVYTYIKYYYENKEKSTRLSKLLGIDKSSIKDQKVTPATLGLEYIDVPK